MTDGLAMGGAKALCRAMFAQSPTCGLNHWGVNWDLVYVGPALVCTLDVALPLLHTGRVSQCLQIYR